MLFLEDTSLLHCVFLVSFSQIILTDHRHELFSGLLVCSIVYVFNPVPSHLNYWRWCVLCFSKIIMLAYFVYGGHITRSTYEGQETVIFIGGHAMAHT